MKFIKMQGGWYLNLTVVDFFSTTKDGEVKAYHINSGDGFVIAKFDTAQEAQEYLDKLILSLYD